MQVEDSTPQPAAIFPTTQTPIPTTKPAVSEKKATTPAKDAPPSKVTQTSEPIKAQTPEPVMEISLSAPLLGTVINTFSGGALVYNKALDDWRAHDGVDLKSKIGTDVIAAGDGIITEVSANTLGNYIVIDHQNGFKTLYANLADEISLTAGKSVKKGDIIGKLGNTSISEQSIEPHLHFEVIQDDKNVNPMDYLE